MYHSGPLIAEQASAPPFQSGRRLPRAAIPVAVLALALVLILATVAMIGDAGRTPMPSAPPPGHVTHATRPIDPARLVVADPTQIEALTQAQAEALNAARPVARLPNPPAPAFVLDDQAPGYPRALACLTAAIYYEAAYEPADGQQAVAQVVLNRVRHPLYPHTVCGVVFQGAERSTGCQFTFTCDGSLARAPVAAVWARVRGVAAAALSGTVYAAVGLSTHYHADYVVPYWSGMMVKTAAIGQHAFYRMPDGYGRPAAFSVPYRQAEPQVAFGMAASLAGLGEPANPADDAVAFARPVLDRSGAMLTAEGAAGKSPRVTGSSAMRTAAAGKAEGRWIIGMDGSHQASTPNIGYEALN